MPRKGMRSLCFSTSLKPAPRRIGSGSGSGSGASSTTSFSFSSSMTAPSTPRRTVSMIDNIIDSAHAIITKWNPDSSSYASVTSLFHESRREAKHFLRCVTELQKAMHLLLPDPSSSPPSSLDTERLVRAQALTQIAAKRLEKEFYQILSTNRAYLDPVSVSARSSRVSRSTLSDEEGVDVDDDDDEDDDDDDDENCTETDDEIRVAEGSIAEAEQASMNAMADLRSIAECMITSGYGKECVRIYKVVRKSIIDEGIYRLGIEKGTSASRIQKLDWKVLEMKIGSWIEAVKIAVKTLLTGERILCDHVFSVSDSIRESCFAEISNDAAMALFGFPAIVVKSKQFQSPDRIFQLLDLYEAISVQWPEIDSIFAFDATACVRSQAITSLAAVSEAAYGMLSAFETKIQKDNSKPPSDGGVHPLTVYAMNFLSLLADYSGVMTDIVADWPPPPKKSQLPETYFQGSDSGDSPDSGHLPAPAFYRRLAWLLLALVCKLDGKAGYFKDVSRSYLFLANNLRHIVAAVRGSGLRHILGGDWIAGHESKLRQFAASYERLGWGHVVTSLPPDPSEEMSAEKAKECFRKFNAEFEKAYRKQASCVVQDDNLRDEIRCSIVGKIVEVYREFYGKHRRTLGCRRNVECMVRYTPDDVENYISDLFYCGDDWGSTSSACSSPSYGLHSKPRRGRGIFG